MKNISKIALLLLAFITINSCEDQENDTFNAGSEGFVQLADESSISVVENDISVIEIDFLLDGPKDSPVTVDVLVLSDDDSRFEVISGTSLTVAPGDVVATLQIRPVDNFNMDGSVDVTVTLSESSSLPIGIGGQNVNSITRTITIADNDCPITIEDFVGTYSVDEVFSEGGTNAGLTIAGAVGRSFQLEFSLLAGDESGTKVVVNTPAGFDPFIPNGTIITFVTCPMQFQFDSNPLRGADFANFTLTGSSYNEATSTLNGSGPLGGFGAYEFVLTKQ